ncbi:glutamate 5-kinase [Candidatus Phycosocius bacilliformis]|uniref:Glutamate 5-kinase n=2 Tax=Candidatus Phycosocius bacilliformis TaxID=1445552 RepID=A0A2P2E692_9PROT|nr:glutamate 5-kinase [Candidatus Phycosocius bacilliformis]GBF56559.1 glutamate 5-kinase [Candidatus Phycosocius bacilliformis]
MTLEALGRAKRIVLKFGSSLIIDPVSGEARSSWLASVAADVVKARLAGQHIVIVSSGAVALGRGALGLPPGKLKLEEKQAAAAAGQVRLMAAWGEAFAPHKTAVAQALVTPDDTERRRRWLNARATLDTLLACGAVPVVNENDTVATDELRYGDNDRLAARVAQMVGADALILFSDVDGLYDADPRDNPKARHIGEVRDISPAIDAMAGGINQKAGVGSGGMRTKIEAARIATAAGCAVAITDGLADHPFGRLIAGGRASWFIPAADRESARRAWLGHSLNPAGSFCIDAGAAKALKAGASLLPIGVRTVEGQFERGDAIAIKDDHGRILAHGISAYSSSDAQQILGRHSDEIEDILGYAGRPALVHRDDLVLS